MPFYRLRVRRKVSNVSNRAETETLRGSSVSATIIRFPTNTNPRPSPETVHRSAPPPYEPNGQDPPRQSHQPPSSEEGEVSSEDGDVSSDDGVGVIGGWRRVIGGRVRLIGGRRGVIR